MRERASHHGRRPRATGAAKLLVVALLAAIVVEPVVSSWHELTVRHVVCAEHGELTHVPTYRGTSPVRETTSYGSIQVDDTAAITGHDHCGGAFLVRGRANVSVIRPEAKYSPPPVVTRVVSDPVLRPGRAFVLASAPKTSPPAA